MTPSCVTEACMRAFLAGALDPEEEHRVAAHLEICARCERLAADLSDDPRARSLASAVRPLEPPPEMDPALADLRQQIEALAYYAPAARSPPTVHFAFDTSTSGEPASKDTYVFLPADGRSPPVSPDAEADDPPRLAQLGPYKIFRTLGAGTFGIVYLAEDERLRRKVALKVARAGVLADPVMKGRFTREAEALARLSHPHIVPVYEADTIDGLSFLAVAYCDGPALDQWLQSRGQPVAPRLAAGFVAALAEAVEHAHARGILHRDIKPSNILLQRADPAENGALVPQLSDFGLAKLAEETSPTSISGMVLGTPQYMAPEQAAGNHDRVCPATDVYSLGAVLFHMLTGRPPVEGASTIDTLRRVLIDTPPSARSLGIHVPEDLEAIVLKCLEKAPRNRYPTAQALADDLRAFLAGRPTVARPLSLVQTAHRWIERNPLPAALLTLTVLVVSLSSGLLYYARRLTDTELAVAAERARAVALAQQVKSSALLIEQRDYVNDVRAAAHETLAGNTAHALNILQRHVSVDPARDQRGTGWHLIWALNTRPAMAESRSPAPILHVATSPDGRELMTGDADGVVRLLARDDLRLLAALASGQGAVWNVAYAPTGRLAATAGSDGTIRIWDLDARTPLREFQAHAGGVRRVAFWAGGRRLMSCGNEKLVRLWNVETGEAVGTLEGHSGPVVDLACSRDGHLVATASEDGNSIVWNLDRGRRVSTFDHKRGPLTSVAVSPEARWVATAALDRTLTLWRARNGRVLARLPLPQVAQSLTFAADASRLWAADRMGAIHQYRLQASVEAEGSVRLVPESPVAAWHAHRGPISAIISEADGTLTSAGEDGSIRRWSQAAADGAQQSLAASKTDPCVDFRFSADGRWLFALHRHSGLTVLDHRTLRPVQTLDFRSGDWTALETLAGDERIAAGNQAGQVVIWNRQTGRVERLLSMPSGAAVAELAYAPLADRLAISLQGAVEVVVAQLGADAALQTIPVGRYSTIAFSPDGQRLAAGVENEVWLYSQAGSGAPVRLSGHSGAIRSIALQPQGRMIATGSGDRTIRLWSDAGVLLATFTEPDAIPAHLAFSADGRTLVVLKTNGEVKLIHTRTRQALFDLPLNVADARWVRVAPKAHRVGVLENSGQLHLLGPHPDEVR